jgi:prevent-host-death family protein
MTDVSATDAARKFADLLDAVERGEEFTIIRRGKAVAHLEPTRRGRGRDLKAVLNAHRPDSDWAADVAATRDLLVVEDRT